jgi:hypothetical protein
MEAQLNRSISDHNHVDNTATKLISLIDTAQSLCVRNGVHKGLTYNWESLLDSSGVDLDCELKELLATKL